MSGPLWHRWNNQLSRYRQSADYTFKNKKKGSVQVATINPTPNYKPTAAELTAIDKVNEYFTPWDIFHSCWMNVYHIRKLDYKIMDYPDLINKWPILSDVKRVQHLVSNMIFPEHFYSSQVS